MALFKFTKAMIKGEEIPVFNYGKHRRDFTYIDDIVEGVSRVLEKPAAANLDWTSQNPDPGSSNVPWRVYNIGNNQPVELMSYISALEKSLSIKANMRLLPLQDGDVPDTYANIEDFIKDFDYKPQTSIEDGVQNFVKWYKDFYNV